MTRPAILYLSQLVPYPLDAGPKVRAYHVLRWLARRARVTLVAFSRADDDPAAIEHLRSFCHAVHIVPMRRSRLADLAHLGQSVAGGESFIIRRDRHPAMTKLLAELSAGQDFDAVHADQLWMAEYGLAVAGRRAPRLRVLDNHNAVFRVFERLASHERSPAKRWLWRRESRLIAAHESQMTRRFDHTVFVSGEDRHAVLGIHPDGADDHAQPPATSVIPICVDAAGVQPIARRPDAQRVTFLGGLHWPPNAEGVTWFAEQVFDRILQRVPTAKLTVIGKGPPAAIQSVAGRRGDAVEVTGFVRDPRPLLEETAAFIVPLRSGGGMRVKILDAWAWGLPVVSTTLGAEGIHVVPGTDILVADEPDTFADAVVSLLTDPAQQQALSEAGRRAVADRYDARRVYDAFEGVFAPVFEEATGAADR